MKGCEIMVGMIYTAQGSCGHAFVNNSLYLQTVMSLSVRTMLNPQTHLHEVIEYESVFTPFSVVGFSVLNCLCFKPT